MTPTSRYLYAATFALAGVGFLLPLWPLCVLAILIAAFSGRWIFATAVALLIDIAWGAPTGQWSFVVFPLTTVALVAGLARIFGGRYFLDRNLPDKL